MVRISIFGMCVLLSLSVSGQEARRPAQPAPAAEELKPVLRLILKRQQSRTDAEGLRCTVGSAQYIGATGTATTESFVEFAGMGKLPQGLYLGAVAITAHGPRLILSRTLTPIELATTYAEVADLTPAQMDELIGHAIAAPLIVKQPVEATLEPQIGIGTLGAQGCVVENDDDTADVKVGQCVKVAIAIEGDLPAPEPERVVPHATTPQPNPQPAATEQADPRERVVNVRNAKGQSIGAGVVLGKTANRLYIVTAQHVVWSGEVKEGVTVSFYSLAGESFPATVLDFSDDALDLAVLSIPTATPGLPEIAKLIVGNTRELVLGATVRSVGHPGGVLWKMAATPEKFSRRISSDLEFESLIADAGSSGGGLFNSCGALIGLTKKAGTSIGVATPIDRVLDRLAEWNIVIPTTTVACASPE